MSTPPPPPPPPPPGGPGPAGQPGYPPAYGQPGSPPIYGQPAYGQPAYGQPGYGGYGQPAAGNPFDPRGHTVMWVGVLSLALSVLCGLGLLLGPVAWIMGNGVRKEARNAGWPEPSENRGGRICGIISTVILVLGVALIALLVVAFRNSSSTLN